MQDSNFEVSVLIYGGGIKPWFTFVLHNVLYFTQCSWRILECANIYIGLLLVLVLAAAGRASNAASV